MKKNYILLLTLAFGLFLRIYRLEELAGFDFDQEKAAFWIRDFLIHGKISLIGQEISTGGIFIGPLYFYLLSPFYFLLNMNPIAANILASLLGIISMFILYKIGQTLFGKKIGLIALFLFAISFRLNFYDRTTAPSNLVMLLSGLIFISLLKLKSGSKKLIFVIAACLGMGFSVHPTMAALFLIVAIIMLFSKFKLDFKHYSLSALIILLFLSPLLLFDLRHNFLNFTGILKVFSAGGFTLDSLFYKIGTNWQALITSLESLFLTKNIGGLAVLAVFFFTIRKQKQFDFKIKWFLIWLGIPFILLSFYPLNVPEYYFLLSFPIFLVFFAHWLYKIFKSRKLVLGGLLLVLAISNLAQLASYDYLVSMKHKKDAVKFVAKSSGEENFNVNYWTNPGQKNGFDYLFWYYGKMPDESLKKGNRFVIALPVRKGINKPNMIFGGIQVIRDDI